MGDSINTTGALIYYDKIKQANKFILFEK